MTSLGRRDSLCKASARRDGVYRFSCGGASMLTDSGIARPAPVRSIYASTAAANPRAGRCPWWKQPPQRNC